MSRSTQPRIAIDLQLARPSDDLAARAEALVADAASHAPAPVLHARVRVVRHRNPSNPRAVVANASLDLPGQLIRAEVAATSEQEALDLLRDRLLAQATHRAQRASGSWEGRRGRLARAEAHEWRHSNAPSTRAPFYPRPQDERQVVPYESVSPGELDLDEAAFDMAAADFTFHLFTERGSGQDSVLYGDGETGYRLAQVKPSPDALAPHDLEVTVSPQVPPLLTVPEAVAQLEAWGRPFLFFLDADHVRGAVVYHRYDGHYGLVTPSNGTPGN